MARTEDPAGRERILSAATALFYVNGVRAVGMAEVIAAAGCGKHMLYRHFPSKAGVAAGEGADAAEAMGAGGQLVALVAEVAAWVQRGDYRGCAFRNYLTEFPADDDEPAAVARDYLRDTRQ